MVNEAYRMKHSHVPWLALVQAAGWPLSTGVAVISMWYLDTMA